MDKGLPEKELRVTADFDANSVTMETMIYDDAGIETSTPLTCNIERASCVFPVAPQNTIFKILLMALDNKAGVVESNTIEFEGKFLRFWKKKQYTDVNQGTMFVCLFAKAPMRVDKRKVHAL